MRAALYARVSTSADRQDLDGQIEDLRRESQRRGWEVADVYSDETSGTKFDAADRPGLAALLAAVDAGGLDVVLILRLDRLGRSLRHLVDVVEHVRSKHVELVTIAGGSLDTTTPMGKAMVQLMGLLAEFESAITSERIREGVARVKRTGKTRSGKPMGRPRRGQEAVNPKRPVDVAAVARLRSQGRSWRSIAMAVGVPVRTIRRAFENATRKAVTKTTAVAKPPRTA